MAPLGLLSRGDKAEIVEVKGKEASVMDATRINYAMRRTWGFV